MGYSCCPQVFPRSESFVVCLQPLSSSPECVPCHGSLWLLIAFILIGDCCLDAESIFFFAGDVLAFGYVSVQGFCSFMNSNLLKQSAITPPCLRCLLSSKVWGTFNLGVWGISQGYIWLSFPRRSDYIQRVLLSIILHFLLFGVDPCPDILLCFHLWGSLQMSS